MDFNLPSVPAAGSGGGGKCPACQAVMLPGAISCMDCGYMAAPDTGGDVNDDVLVCANPQCGAANPKGEKNCIRCSQILPPPPGTVLHGRYRIDKQLAVGGFGAVYLATDNKTTKPVAIKDMICDDPGEFAIRLNFFRREAEILRALETVPIVPRVHDLIEKGDTAHLIMEFIRGKDLLKIMEAANNKPFPVEMVVEWSKSICDVLTVMHSQQPPLVHRDLKPDNIMLLEDQKTIKMIDFGTARDIGKTAKERAAGKTRVYTEGYAPPEQIIGKPEARSDLFALAATMFHLVTGKSPEGTFTAKEMETELAKGSACTYPAKYRWFYELMKINMAEDINDRYFSAKEFKADLVKGQVSKETACGKCKATNEVRRPYCQKCAGPLTDATVFCNQCGKNNVLGSRFCIYCGNRLR
jgi:serine/threonine protein kinase